MLPTITEEEMQKWASSVRHYLCAECHKYFRNKIEYYWHSEECLLESLQHEWELTRTVTTQKPREFEQDVEEDVIDADEWQQTAGTSSSTHQKNKFPQIPPIGMTIKTSSSNSKEDYALVNVNKDLEAPGSWCQKKKAKVDVIEEGEGEGSSTFIVEEETEEQRNQREADRIKTQEVIAGPRGSKIVVTVEPQVVESQSSQNFDGDDGDGPPQLVSQVGGSQEGKNKADEEQEEDEDDEMEFNREAHSLSYMPTNKVVGALGNANADESWKPKMECPTCGLVLYRHNFATHFRIHTGEMPFACDFCGRRFRTTSSLKVHIRVHTGERPYVCPSCDYATITKRNLDRHIINHHIRKDTLKGPLQRKSRYPHATEEYIRKNMRDGNTGGSGESSSHQNKPDDHTYMMMPEEEEVQEEGVEYEEVVEELIEGEEELREVNGEILMEEMEAIQ